MNLISPRKLLISLSIPLGIGFLGSIFTTPSIDSWYSQINKPIFTPPNWVFAPVWTILFVLMGISFYLIWVSKKGKNSKLYAHKIYFLHLGLNLLWSILFFGLKNPGFALLEILTLWVVIFYMIKIFGKINKLSAQLLYPYLAWVSFATLLNFAVWLGN